MSSNMDRLFAGVEWRPLPGEMPVGIGGLPVATHEAILIIGSARLRVFQLSDGRRIIDADDFAAFFFGPAPTTDENNVGRSPGG